MGNESLKNRNIILNTAKDTFKANKDAFIHEYMEALKIPSISLDSNYNAQSDRCAKFFNEWLLKIGLESKIITTNGNIRSLNLSNCVAIVLYEALRQQKYNDLSKVELIKGENYLEL